MKRYKLYYSELNSTSEVQRLEFSSVKKRELFVSDKIYDGDKKKVFVFIAKYTEQEEEPCIFVFQHRYSVYWFLKSNNVKEFWLFEFNTYKEAYEYCIEYKEGF